MRRVWEYWKIKNYVSEGAKVQRPRNEKIWNDSGDEDDFDSDENKVEFYELVGKDKIDKPEDLCSWHKE